MQHVGYWTLLWKSIEKNAKAANAQTLGKARNKIVCTTLITASYEREGQLTGCTMVQPVRFLDFSSSSTADCRALPGLRSPSQTSDAKRAQDFGRDIQSHSTCARAALLSPREHCLTENQTKTQWKTKTWGMFTTVTFLLSARAPAFTSPASTAGHLHCLSPPQPQNTLENEENNYNPAFRKPWYISLRLHKPSGFTLGWLGTSLLEEE